MFSRVLLEKEQEELLITLVEASRNVPREQREKFYSFQSVENNLAHVIHPGLPKDFPGAYMGDIEILGSQGLINLSYENRKEVSFGVAPAGFRYYEHLKAKVGESTKRVENTLAKYLETPQFQKKYPLSFQKWMEAEAMLWSSETEKQLTIIGHLCREAIQEFVSELVERTKPVKVDDNKTHTISRLKSVVNTRGDKFGESEKAFYDALITYWGAVSDLIQRQEHGDQKEGRPLTWEDGRRIVFQIIVLMYEIDRVMFS